MSDFGILGHFQKIRKRGKLSQFPPIHSRPTSTGVKKLFGPISHLYEFFYECSLIRIRLKIFQGAKYYLKSGVAYFIIAESENRTK